MEDAETLFSLLQVWLYGGCLSIVFSATGMDTWRMLKHCFLFYRYGHMEDVEALFSLLQVWLHGGC